MRKIAMNKLISPNKSKMRAYEEELIRPIVKRMDTKLTPPDQVIISQYSEGKALYIISKGECVVTVNQDSIAQKKKRKKGD